MATPGWYGDSMSKAIIIAVPVVAAIVAAYAGSVLSHAAIAMALGVIFGIMFVAPAALIAAACTERNTATITHQVDIYSQTVAVQPTVLAVQPERWFVVERDVLVLPSATQGKLEVRG